MVLRDQVAQDLLTHHRVEHLAHALVGMIDGRLGKPSSLVADARKAGLAVHAWAFRAENHFLPTDLRRGYQAAAHGDLAAELQAFYAAGVDAVFSDFPAAAVAARKAKA